MVKLGLILGPRRCLLLWEALAHERSRIEYNKKKDKVAVIKAIKDETVQKDDVYKSHAIHVASGEPPSSVSRPPAKRKAGVVRPITKGKLLRKGGPSTDVCQLTLRA